MIQLLVIMIVAVVITMTVEVFKKLKLWLVDTIKKVKNKKYSDITIGLPLALVFGFSCGYLLEIGLVHVLLNVFKLEYMLPMQFLWMSKFFTSILLSQGSGGVISLAESLISGIGKLLDLFAESRASKNPLDNTQDAPSIVYEPKS